MKEKILVYVVIGRIFRISVTTTCPIPCQNAFTRESEVGGPLFRQIPRHVDGQRLLRRPHYG